MADRFPFMRVYKEMADALPKEDRADFYDALIGYALDDKEPEPSTGAAVFQAARRMVDTWKMKSAAGKASAAKRGNVFGGCSEGVRNTTRTGIEHSLTKEEKNKRIKDKKNKEKDILLTKNIEKEQQPKAAAASAQVRPEDVMELYNSICTSMPKATKITEARRRSIKARLRENEPHVFREVFEKAEASDFLTGRSGKWGRCNFDWIIDGPTHWQKILEGIYDNDDRGRPNAADSLRDKLNVNDEDRERAARLG